MRRFAMLALAVMIAAPACDDDDNGPSSQPLVFTAQLSGANENPPISNSESGGTGSVVISMLVPRDSSGNVTGPGTANFQFQLGSLPAGTAIRLAHIHIGPTGVNGMIRVDTGLTIPTAITLTDGTGTINAIERSVSQEDAQNIMNNPAGYYFNAHSNLNPGGVVRGQLVRVQ